MVRDTPRPRRHGHDRGTTGLDKLNPEDSMRVARHNNGGQLGRDQFHVGDALNIRTSGDRSGRNERA